MGVDFGGAEFGDTPRFDGATFADGTSFKDVRFLNDASFAHATFGERAVFSRAVFKGEARFDKAQFQGEAHFDGVAVGRCLSFADCVFERERHLGPVLALDKLSLDDAVFVQPADLDLVADCLSLQRARFPAGANLWVRWAEVDLENAYFGASSILGKSTPFGDLTRRPSRRSTCPTRSARRARASSPCGGQAWSI